MVRALVIGTRGSKLALWQAEHARNSLLAIDPTLSIKIEVIKTTGDVKSEPLTVIGGKGVFTKELEEALLDRRIDIAVHSLKDLPTVLAPELTIAAIGEREDHRDALVLRDPRSTSSLAQLHPQTVVGTSSQRRLAQLKAKRPDVIVKDLRGNVDTRLRKLDEGQYDALVLAAAGLVRLGLSQRISMRITTDEMVPAVGQGALGIETRADDDFAIETVKRLDHHETHLACLAERALLRTLGGGCQLPIAAHGTISSDTGELSLVGLVASPDGSKLIRQLISGPTEQAEELGNTLAGKLRDAGADELLRDLLA